MSTFRRSLKEFILQNGEGFWRPRRQWRVHIRGKYFGTRCGRDFSASGYDVSREEADSLERCKRCFPREWTEKLPELYGKEHELATERTILT